MTDTYDRPLRRPGTHRVHRRGQTPKPMREPPFISVYPQHVRRLTPAGPLLNDSMTPDRWSGVLS